MRSFLAASLVLLAVVPACEEHDPNTQLEIGSRGAKDPEPLSEAVDEVHNGTELTPFQANSLGVVSVRSFRWKENFSGAPQEDTEGSGVNTVPKVFCSGIIYKKQWVITAKHCWMSGEMDKPVTEKNFFGAEIFDGSVPRKSLDKSYKVSVHPDLDIAIVKLNANACQENDTSLACTNIFLSAATPDTFKDLKISHVECAGYADLKRGDAKPTIGRFPVDLTVSVNDFVKGNIFSNTFFKSVENAPIEEQNKWWKLNTCERSRALVGDFCIYSKNPLPYMCGDLSTADKSKCTFPTKRPIIVKGDSGGPCFANSIKSRSLVGVIVASRRDDRENGGTILNEATTLGFAWPWLAEQGLVRLPSSPQKNATNANIPNISLFSQSSQFLINFGSGFLDFVTIAQEQIFWARNNGSAFDPFQTIASEQIDPSTSYFFDFDQDGSYELIWMKGNDFKVRKSNVANNILQNFQPDTSYKLPFVAEGPWSDTTSFLLPIFGTPYYGIARIDENLFRFIPWNPVSGFDVLQKIEFFLNKNTSIPNFEQVDFLYLDEVDELVDFVGFNQGKLLLKAGILNADLSLPIERAIVGDCKQGAFKTMIDLNNDGRADYLCIDRESIKSWVSTSSDFQFQSKPFITSFDLVRDWEDDASLIDIDLDGTLDIVVSFRTKSYSKNSSGFVNRRIDSAYIMYHLGKGDGRFGSAHFVSLPSEIASDVAASGASNLISSMVEIDDNKGTDAIFVGKKNVWLQPQIVNPKINAIMTKTPTIHPWRKLLWKKRNLHLILSCGVAATVETNHAVIGFLRKNIRSTCCEPLFRRFRLLPFACRKASDSFCCSCPRCRFGLARFNSEIVTLVSVGSLEG